MFGYPKNKRKKYHHLISSLQKSVLQFTQVRFLFFDCVTYFNMALFQLSPATDRTTINSATPQIHNDTHTHTHTHTHTPSPLPWGLKGIGTLSSIWVLHFPKHRCFYLSPEIIDNVVIMVWALRRWGGNKWSYLWNSIPLWGITERNLTRTLG